MRPADTQACKSPPDKGEQVHALMERLAKRDGKDGMQAIATLMHDLGSDTLITFSDETWLPCDFLMQHAWELGGKPSPSN